MVGFVPRSTPHTPEVGLPERRVPPTSHSAGSPAGKPALPGRVGSWPQGAIRAPWRLSLNPPRTARRPGAQHREQALGRLDPSSAPRPGHGLRPGTGRGPVGSRTRDAVARPWGLPRNRPPTARRNLLARITCPSNLSPRVWLPGLNPTNTAESEVPHGRSPSDRSAGTGRRHRHPSPARHRPQRLRRSDGNCPRSP